VPRTGNSRPSAVCAMISSPCGTPPDRCELLGALVPAVFYPLRTHFAQPSSWRLFDDVPELLAALDMTGVPWGLASTLTAGCTKSARDMPVWTKAPGYSRVRSWGGGSPTQDSSLANHAAIRAEKQRMIECIWTG